MAEGAEAHTHGSRRRTAIRRGAAVDEPRHSDGGRGSTASTSRVRSSTGRSTRKVYGITVNPFRDLSVEKENGDEDAGYQEGWYLDGQEQPSFFATWDRKDLDLDEGDRMEKWLAMLLPAPAWAPGARGRRSSRRSASSRASAVASGAPAPAHVRLKHGVGLVGMNWPLLVISKVLGHTSTKTTGDLRAPRAERGAGPPHKLRPLSKPHGLPVRGAVGTHQRPTPPAATAQ